MPGSANVSGVEAWSVVPADRGAGGTPGELEGEVRFGDRRQGLWAFLGGSLPPGRFHHAVLQEGSRPAFDVAQPHPMLSGGGDGCVDTIRPAESEALGLRADGSQPDTGAAPGTDGVLERAFIAAAKALMGAHSKSAPAQSMVATDARGQSLGPSTDQPGSSGHAVTQAKEAALEAKDGGSPYSYSTSSASVQDEHGPGSVDERTPERASDSLHLRTHTDRVLEFHARSLEKHPVVDLVGNEAEASVPNATSGGKMGPAAVGSGARAAAGESPAQTIPTDVWLARESILERISDQTLSLLRMGRREAEIHLEPPELGKLKLRLTVSGTSVQGFIEVENPGVRALLQSDLSSLSSALGERGLNLSQFDVLLMGEGHRGHRRQSGDATGPQGAAVQDEEPEVPDAVSARTVGGGRLLDYWL